MKVYLKGGIDTSIDESGLQTRTTTWMLVDDSGGSVFSHWVSFQESVNTWAGKIGQPYKKPVQDANSRECTTFTSDTSFLVSAINIVTVNRTHFEVTYTNVQNSAVMTLIGNINVNINNNNERTKTATYRVTVALDGNGDANPKAIDAFLIPSGTVITWSDGLYMVTDSSYTAQNARVYNVNLTAKDMSVMMIGSPTESTDPFGQKIKSVTYRYSKTAYDAWTQPEIGTDASAYLGLDENSGYLVHNINAEPDGVLGYIVKIETRHVSKRLVRLEENLSNPSKNWLSGAVTHETDFTAIYQCKSEHLDEFREMMGKEAGIAPGTTIQTVRIIPQSKEEYEVTLSSKDDNSNIINNNYNNSPEYLRTQVDISVNYTDFVLEAEMVGYKRGLSDIDWVEINNPPTTTFRYRIDTSTLTDLHSEWTQATIDALKVGDMIGFSRVAGRYNTSLQLIDEATTYTGKVTGLKLEDYCYAQPGTSTTAKTVRNLIWKPWYPMVSMPMFPSKSWRTDFPTYKSGKGNSVGAVGLPKAMDRAYIGKKIKMIECSVGRYYKGNIRSVLPKRSGTFLADAMSEIKLPSEFLSFKQNNIQVSEIKDNQGNIWTKVTQTVLSPVNWYWNFNYEG